jgi:hypothetical protein
MAAFFPSKVADGALIAARAPLSKEKANQPCLRVRPQGPSASITNW